MSNDQTNREMYMFIKKSLSLLLLSSFCFACTAQKIKISGQVVSATGIPVSRAEVITLPATDIVSTDREGYFYIDRRIVPGTGEKEAITPGVYQIRVSKDGFLPLEFSVNAKKGEVWADRRTMQAEKAMINSVAPEETQESETMPTGGGGMVGF